MASQHDQRDALADAIERRRGDVLHDNFVPEYSRLATAAPSRLVVVGTWLLFGPTAVGGSVAVLVGLSSHLFGTTDLDAAPDPFDMLRLACGAFVTALALAVVVSVTRRWWRSPGVSKEA